MELNKEKRQSCLTPVWKEEEESSSSQIICNNIAKMWRTCPSCKIYILQVMGSLLTKKSK